MQIIVLQGSANTGKTSTLKKLDKILQGKCTPPKDIKKGRKEVCKTYNINIGGKDYKIGIWSKGDYEDALKDGLTKLKQEKCAYAIVACRTKGNGLKYLERNYDVLFIVRKRIAANPSDNKACDKLNLSDAQKLEYLLFKMII